MKVIFELSGTMLFEADLDQVPASGSLVRLRTENYKKGLHAGSLISFEVGRDEAPVYDLSSVDSPVVYISVNGYEIIEAGPKPDED